MTALEHELKYRLPARHLAPALAWVEAHCRREARHADNRVVSVYYDTPRLALLQESFGSDWAKSKVRLRWYEPVAGGPPSGLFLEVKERFGKRRRKARVPVADAGLATRPLEDPAWRTALAALPADAGVPRTGLLPVLSLAYRRRRFVDRFSAARISIDSDVAVRAANRALLHCAARRPLDLAIVEVKSVAGDLPPTLRGLLGLGLRFSSLSKYRVAFEAARTGAS